MQRTQVFTRHSVSSVRELHRSFSTDWEGEALGSQPHCCVSSCECCDVGNRGQGLEELNTDTREC